MVKFEGHNLVIGMSGSGKGKLVASKATAWAAMGPDMHVYLLCNKQEEYDTFPAHFKTKDQARLLDEVKKLKAPAPGFVNTLVIIDEAWAWNWKDKENGLQLIPNMARGLGVEMWVQSQFPTQMAPTVRANCDNIYCFRQRDKDAVKWAQNCYGDIFEKCAELEPGRFIGLRGMGEPFLGCSWYVDDNGKFHSA